MDVLDPRCCGLDVHKREIVACVVRTDSDGTPHQEVRAFATMTPDILALADWLAAQEVSHVAMESTGVYWQPIGNLLEDSFALLLVNVRHLTAVPGRQTDVRDGEWWADWLRHGRLTSSVVPDRPQRELRELTRYRASLVRERTAAANRLQQTREGANLKLAAVVSDSLGKAGREILAALVAGEPDGTVLAQRAQGRLRETMPQLERALVGCVGEHQRFLVAEQVAPIDVLDAAMARVSAAIAARVRPVEEAIARPETIPGVGPVVAEALVAESGPDPRRCPSAQHLTSWAGLCPGNHESGDKRRSGSTRPGLPLAAGLPGPSRAHRGADQGHLPRGAVPSAGGPSRQGEGDRCCCPLHSGHRRPPADAGHDLSRPGWHRL